MTTNHSPGTVDVDITDTAALGRIVDDANRNGAGLTVRDLAYALREHRLRASLTVEFWEPSEPRRLLVQIPASTSDARKRNTEKAAGGEDR